MSILIVDDSLEMLEAYASMLYGYSAKIELLDSAEKCIDYMKDNEVSCIISDLCMPGMGGVEFFKYIKKNMGYSGIFIIITAFWEKELDYLLEEGVSRVFEKPVAYDDLCVYLKEKDVF